MSVKDFMKDWSKFLSFGGMCFVLVGATIFLFGNPALRAKGETPPPYEFLSLDPQVVTDEMGGTLTVSTLKADLTVIQFSGKDMVRLSSDTKARISFVPDGVKVMLDAGELWVSRLSGDPKILVQTGDTMLLPGVGSGSISTDGPLIQASNSPLFSATFKDSAIPAFPDVLDLNAEDMTVIFPFETSEAGETQPEDLTGKECGGEGCKNFHPWFQKNEKLDDALLQKYEDGLEAGIRTRGLHFQNLDGFSFGLRQKLLRAGNFFTLLSGQEAKETEQLASLLIEDAFYFALLDKQQEADARFSFASKFMSELNNPLSAQSFWLKSYRTYAWIPFQNKFSSLRDLLRYETMKQDPGLAPSLSLETSRDRFDSVSAADPLTFLFELKKYENEVENFLPASGEKERLASFYGLSRRILEHLFEKNAETAYSKEFLASLAFFENRLLDLADKENIIKEAGGLMLEKLSFLQKGEMLLAKNTNPETVRAAMLELASQADDLAKKLPANDLNRKEKEQYFTEKFPLFAFLRQASEGITDFPAEYAAYAKQSDENERIENLLYGAPLEASEQKQDFDKQVKEDLFSIGIKSFELIVPKDSEWYGIQKAELEGVSFRANYSPKRQAFRNIVIAGKTYPFSIPLNKFAVFITGTLPQTTPSITAPPAEEGPLTPLEETKFEKLLKSRVLEKFELVGLTVREENVRIVDGKKALIAVTEAFVSPDPTAEPIPVSFVFSNADNQVQELRVKTPLNEILVADTFELRDLAMRAKLIFERAKLEQERLQAEPPPLENPPR